MHARVQAFPRVLQRRVRLREVDDHVGIADDVLQVGFEEWIRATDERHVVGALHGVADRLTHPARRAGYGYVDHAAASEGLTASRAARKLSSEPPTPAADIRVG